MKEQTSEVMTPIEHLKEFYEWCKKALGITPVAVSNAFVELERNEKQLTELTAHNALMREALGAVMDYFQAQDNKGAFVSGVIFNRVRRTLESTPSQSTTLLRNKVIQECIDSLKTELDEFKKLGRLPEAYGVSISRKALQALLDKKEPANER